MDGDPERRAVEAVLNFPSVSSLPEGIRTGLGGLLLDVTATPYGRPGPRLSGAYTFFEKQSWEVARSYADIELRSASERAGISGKQASAALAAADRAGRREAWYAIEEPLRRLAAAAGREAGIRKPAVLEDVANAVVRKARCVLVSDLQYEGKESDARHADRLMAALSAGYVPRGRVGSLIFIYRANGDADQRLGPSSESARRPLSSIRPQHRTPKASPTAAPAKAQRESPAAAGVLEEGLDRESLMSIIERLRPELRSAREQDSGTAAPDVPSAAVPREGADRALRECAATERAKEAAPEAGEPRGAQVRRRVRRTDLSDEQIRRILELASLGRIPSGVSRETGVGINTVRHLMRQKGYTFPTGRPVTLAKESVQRIRERLFSGKGELLPEVCDGKLLREGITALSEELGIKRSTVKRFVDREMEEAKAELESA